MATSPPDPAETTLEAILRGRRAPESFARRARRSFATTPVAWSLLGANVAVFLAMAGAGVSPSAPDPAALIAWGANVPAFVRDGEPWRLLTACFLHGGVLHLLVNMVSLASVRVVETWFGRLAFGVVYVGAGLAGSLGSAALGDSLVPSVGASGALFGVVGAILGAAWRWRRLGMDADASRRLVRSVLTVLLVNGAIALSIPHLDHAAHGGGFVAGVLLGYLLAHAPTTRAVAARARRGWLAAAGVLAGTALLSVLLRAPGLAGAAKDVLMDRSDREELEAASLLAELPPARLDAAREDWIPWLVAREAALRRAATDHPSLAHHVEAELDYVRRIRGRLERLVAAR